MSDAKGPEDAKPDRSPSKADPGLSRRLEDLDRRIDKSRTVHSAKVGPEPPKRPGVAMAMRLGADFVAGVVLGAAIGWGIDQWFGTSPWGLAVFLLLGFAAGLLSVLRSAGLVAKRPELDDDPATRRLK